MKVEMVYNNGRFDIVYSDGTVLETVDTKEEAAKRLPFYRQHIGYGNIIN